MSSKTNILKAWNEYREIPAIHAAGIVSVFFAAAFLNYGWMLAVFALYALLAVRSLRSRRGRSLLVYVQCLSLEAAVLSFGLLYEICFQAWMPVLPSFHPILRTLLWVMLACVLLSTRFFLIARVVDASSDAHWFDYQLKNTTHAVISFTLLVGALSLFILAQFGPDSAKIPDLILRSMVPEIL